jgi:hypothetical protein
MGWKGSVKHRWRVPIWRNHDSLNASFRRTPESTTRGVRPVRRHQTHHLIEPGPGAPSERWIPACAGMTAWRESGMPLHPARVTPGVCDRRCRSFRAARRGFASEAGSRQNVWGLEAPPRSPGVFGLSVLPGALHSRRAMGAGLLRPLWTPDQVYCPRCRNRSTRMEATLHPPDAPPRPVRLESPVCGGVR